MTLHAPKISAAHHEPSHGVVDVDLPVGHGEEEQPRVLGPADAGQVHARQLLAPDAVAVDAPHDDGAVLVHDADLLPVRVPRHPPHHGLVPVVDHLLVPTPWLGGKLAIAHPEALWIIQRPAEGGPQVW